MRVQLFNNKTGLIHGNDPKRIGCDASGILKIGATEVCIVAGEDAVMPTLLHGGTGRLEATFTDILGSIYRLDTVTVRGGRIEAPPPVKVELMELRIRADEAEERLRVLEGIFDTNALNFLIK